MYRICGYNFFEQIILVFSKHFNSLPHDHVVFFNAKLKELNNFENFIVFYKILRKLIHLYLDKF